MRDNYERMTAPAWSAASARHLKALVQAKEREEKISQARADRMAGRGIKCPYCDHRNLHNEASCRNCQRQLP